jgi:AcrR family transcriptional regulator
MSQRGRPREFDTEQCLDAVMRLFWQHGYEGTSMAMICEATGVNVPSLYAAFGNKEALFKATLDRYMRQEASYLPEAMKAPTLREAVDRALQGAMNLAEAHGRPGGCMLVQGALAVGPTAETIRTTLTGKRAAAEACVLIRLYEARTDGDLPPDCDPVALAAYLVTVIWGLSVQAAGGATRPQLEAVAKHVLATLPAGKKRTRKA